MAGCAVTESLKAEIRQVVAVFACPVGDRWVGTGYVYFVIVAQLAGPAGDVFVIEMRVVTGQAVIQGMGTNPVRQNCARSTVARRAVQVFCWSPVVGLVAKGTAAVAGFNELIVKEHPMAAGAVGGSEYRWI